MTKVRTHIIAYGYFFKKGNGTISRYGTSTVENSGTIEDYLSIQKDLAEALLKEEGLNSLDSLVFNYFSILHTETDYA